MTAKCQICGKEFHKNRGCQKYCSDKCRRLAKVLRKKNYKDSEKKYRVSYTKRYNQMLKECIEENGGCFECPYEDCIF